MKNLYVQELKDHLPPECEDNLSKGDWDLHQSQEGVSIIAKNLDCGYAHEVWNCSNACRETKIWVIKRANHDERKYHLKMMQTQDKMRKLTEVVENMWPSCYQCLFCICLVGRVTQFLDQVQSKAKGKKWNSRLILIYSEFLIWWQDLVL